MFFVTGATGNVGRELVNLLLAADADVRALTRNPNASGLPAGVDVVGGDLKQNPRALDGALDCVTTVFLNPAAIQEPSDFLEHARDRGVKKIVLLSALPVRDDLPIEDQPGFIARRHKSIEQSIESSDMDWVHVRSNMLMSNAFFELAPQIRAGDIYRGAYPESTSAPVDEHDVAAVVARTMLDDSHSASTYKLTGPQSLTHREKISIIGDALGRAIAFEEMTREEAQSMLLAAFPVQHSNGLADDHIDTVFNYMEESIGKPAFVADTVERVTGRPAGTYAQWATRHTAAFRLMPAGV